MRKARVVSAALFAATVFVASGALPGALAQVPPACRDLADQALAECIRQQWKAQQEQARRQQEEAERARKEQAQQKWQAQQEQARQQWKAQQEEARRQQEEAERARKEQAQQKWQAQQEQARQQWKAQQEEARRQREEAERAKKEQAQRQWEALQEQAQQQRKAQQEEARRKQEEAQRQLKTQKQWTPQAAPIERVLTRPGTPLFENPSPTDAEGSEPLDPFTVFYVYNRKQIDSAQWLQVGRSTKGADGWIRANRAIDWKQALVVAFTNPANRNRTLLFRNKTELVKLIESSDATTKVAGYRQAVLTGRVPPNYPVISIEPSTHIDIQENFYLLPILSFDDAYFKSGFSTRILQVAATACNFAISLAAATDRRRGT